MAGRPAVGERGKAPSVPDVVVARTVVAVPFTYRARDSLHEWAQRLATREFVDETGRASGAMWLPLVEDTSLEEFSEEFRSRLEDLGPRGWRRLVLRDEVRRKLLRQASLVEDSSTLCRPELEGIEAVVFPRGTGLVLLRLRWPRGDLRALLRWVAAARHIRAGPTGCGWTFGEGHEVELPDATVAFLGPRIADAVYRGGWLTLSDLTDWLLLLPREDPRRPTSRVAGITLGWHHTAAAIGERVSEATLASSVYHLCRGLPVAGPVPLTVDDSMAPRSGCRISTCPEGHVSLAWMPQHDEATIGAEDAWTRRFMGPFLLLSVEANREADVLAGMARRGADAIEQLEKAHHHPEDMEWSRVTAAQGDARERLRDMTLELVYVLATRPPACGGAADLVRFQQGVREAFGVTANVQRGVALTRQLVGLLSQEHLAAAARVHEFQLRLDRASVEAGRRQRIEEQVAGAAERKLAAAYRRRVDTMLVGLLAVVAVACVVLAASATGWTCAAGSALVAGGAGALAALGATRQA